MLSTPSRVSAEAYAAAAFLTIVRDTRKSISHAPYGKGKQCSLDMSLAQRAPCAHLDGDSASNNNAWWNCTRAHICSVGRTTPHCTSYKSASLFGQQVQAPHAAAQCHARAQPCTANEPGGSTGRGKMSEALARERRI